jgi:hypothetical protein
VADLCPALPGYHLRALVGRDVRGEVGLYPARRVLRDPPRAPPFLSRLLPLRACISLLSVCPSLSLFCARRAPAKMMRNAEISKNLKGTPLCATSKNLIGAPLRANRCREMPRGRRVFLCGAWPQFGTYYVQNALDKTSQSTPFFRTERYLSALGVRHAVAPYPVLLRSAPVLRYVLPVNRRGTGWRWERKSVRLASTATVKSIDPDAFMRSWTKLPVITF